ncbi:PDCD5-like superfamily [Forsythia ovata]|uniref:PDCD5-like superfamily n=1 Tax=Forsythia ovata TaxID=205694 RepID=A0ABD1X669_9LAMI
MVSTEEHDRCVLELRKKEQRNKRRRERYAEARREQQMQFQNHAGNSHVAAAEKRLLRNGQGREVTTKKKELREQEYAHFEGGVSLQNKRSKRLVQLACYDTIVDECTVENELSAGCEGVLHDRGSASGSRRFIDIRSVARIALVKPDKARGVEDVILRAAQMGQIAK